MEDSSSTITLHTQPRKRSISESRHSSADGRVRPSLIKTKIQKIDGQYKASTTCTIIDDHESPNHSDDLDEPLIVATVPPIIKDSSNYRNPKINFDDETGDDQQSNSSSPGYSPLQEQGLPMSSTSLTTTPASFIPHQSLSNDEIQEFQLDSSYNSQQLNMENNQNAFLVETSITNEEIMSTEANMTTTITDYIQSNLPVTSSAMTIESEKMSESTSAKASAKVSSITTVSSVVENNQSPVRMEKNSFTIKSKPTSSNAEISKLKVRLTTTPIKPSTKTNSKPTASANPNKSTGLKSTKTAHVTKQLPNNQPKKSVSSTIVTTKATVQPLISKPALSSINSEKSTKKRSSTIPSSSKGSEKKTSDNSNSTSTKKKNDTNPVVTTPVKVGKIPKLNPAANVKTTDKPVSSVSLTEQRQSQSVISISNSGDSSKSSNTNDKIITNIHRTSPKSRPVRPMINNPSSLDPMAPISPMEFDDNLQQILRRQTNHSSQYSTSKFSRNNSIEHDNARSQSPLSPEPTSTIYPPPSPPLIDSRSNSSYLHSSCPDLARLPVNRTDLSKAPVMPFSSMLPKNQPVILPSLALKSNGDQASLKKTRPNDIWDSSSSGDETTDDSVVRRFYDQNMRAVDEELSKMRQTNTSIQTKPINTRTEQLLNRQKKAQLCVSSVECSSTQQTIEPSASVDDFECVAMDLDSPKHRTQSENNDSTPTVVESITNQSKSNNGTAVTSKIDTSKILSSRTRPLKTTSMTLIDEMKNSINPASSSKQTARSPVSRSSSHSRTRSRSRTKSRSRSRLRSRSLSRSRSRSRTRSRTRSRSRSKSRSRSSRSSTSSSSGSSRKRITRSRHRSTNRRSSKHYQRHRSNSSDDDTNLPPSNHHVYSTTSINPTTNHHQNPHHHHHQHHNNPSHHPPPWSVNRQNPALILGHSGPPPPPPSSYGHQPPVPPLLPPQNFYSQPNRPMLHHQPPVEPSGSHNGRFNYPQSHPTRPHPPLMHQSYYQQGPPQPLMPPTNRPHLHQPMNRYPMASIPHQGNRPFDMPPHPMSISNPGPHMQNPNYNQYQYESDDRSAQRRLQLDVASAGNSMNINSRRPMIPSTGFNGNSRYNNQSKAISNSSERFDYDRGASGQGKSYPESNEIADQSSSITSQQSKINSNQDDEDEEGEISESD